MYDLTSASGNLGTLRDLLQAGDEQGATMDEISRRYLDEADLLDDEIP